MGVTLSVRYRPRAPALPPGPKQDIEMIRDSFLARRYCTADCLLNAVRRGYPEYHRRTLTALMGQKGNKK